MQVSLSEASILARHRFGTTFGSRAPQSYLHCLHGSLHGDYNVRFSIIESAYVAVNGILLLSAQTN